jgi:hypothetical protein
MKIKKMEGKYVLLKKLNDELSIIKFYNEQELLVHLEAMWRNTKWKLVSITTI